MKNLNVKQNRCAISDDTLKSSFYALSLNVFSQESNNSLSEKHFSAQS